MPRIFLSPSMQNYACAHGDTEKQHCAAYIGFLAEYLTASGFECRRNTGTTFQEAVAQSNAFLPDIHYCAATQQSDGRTRFSLLLAYELARTSPAYGCAELVKQYRAQVYPKPIYIRQNRELYEILSTKAPCLYDFIVFHDSRDDAALFHERMRDFARLTAQALCDHFGLALANPKSHAANPAPPPDFAVPAPIPPTPPAEPMNPDTLPMPPMDWNIPFMPPSPPLPQPPFPMPMMPAILSPDAADVIAPAGPAEPNCEDMRRLYEAELSAHRADQEELERMRRKYDALTRGIQNAMNAPD